MSDKNQQWRLEYLFQIIKNAGNEENRIAVFNKGKIE